MLTLHSEYPSAPASPDVTALRRALRSVGVRPEDLAREIGCSGSYARMQLAGQRPLTGPLRALATEKVRERVAVAIASALCALEIAAEEAGDE
jgi:hypothetical protein